MKITKSKSDVIQLILTGMITDKIVLSTIAHHWDDSGLFGEPMQDLVAGWCIKYFKSFGEAPGLRHIKPIFWEWSSSRELDKNSSELFDRILDHLEDESKKKEVLRSDFLIRIAQNHFNWVRYKKGVQKSSEDVDSGVPIDQINSDLKSIRLIELDDNEEDVDEDWMTGFDKDRPTSLFSYPGDLGAFLGSDFDRSRFIAFMGVDKSGKSMWLIDALCRAVMKGLNVIYFECGDMDKQQVRLRVSQRITRRPLYQGNYSIPKEFNEDGSVSLIEKEFQEVSFVSLNKKLHKATGFLNLPRIRCKKSGATTVDGINDSLEKLEAKGWSPDVVVVDYADILGPPKGVKDPLDQIDENWRRLKWIANDFSCLVLTATQANAGSYSQKGSLSRANFSGRKTKLAHVDGMIGINVSSDLENVTRINWVVRRYGPYKESFTVHVAGAPAIGCPCLFSQFSSSFKQNKENS